MSRVVLVPGALALSPRYGSLSDPVPELRAAVLSALEWVGAGGVAVQVVGTDQGKAVIEELLRVGTAEGTALVIVANGSAKRTEKAPGHFDDRALRFDDQLREWLTIDPHGLAELDRAEAEELWADVAALPALADALTGAGQARLVAVDYDDDPFGVKYWVIRWEISDE